MKIKICGIDSLESLQAAVKAGADAIGFVVRNTHLAEDAIEPDKAKELISLIPPFISTVAVTHLTDVDEIVGLVKHMEATTVQIHAYVPPEDVMLVRQRLKGIKIIKAVHVIDREAIRQARSFEPHVDAILLDSRTKERLGGTGITHDWNISREIVEKCKKPVILAGGLNPDNVFDAVVKVRPFAVDVNSGVETDRIKDLAKVIRFINRARQGELQIG